MHSYNMKLDMKKRSCGWSVGGLRRVVVASSDELLAHAMPPPLVLVLLAALCVPAEPIDYTMPCDVPLMASVFGAAPVESAARLHERWARDRGGGLRNASHGDCAAAQASARADVAALAARGITRGAAVGWRRFPEQVRVM